MSGYSPIIESNCGCYEAVPMSSCAKTITLNQLTTGLEYFIRITDKFRNVFSLTVTAIANRVIIGVFEYPDDTFNEYTGEFNLECFLNSDHSTPVQFTFGGNQYECIHISFVHTEPSIDDETIR